MNILINLSEKKVQNIEER